MEQPAWSTSSQPRSPLAAAPTPPAYITPGVPVAAVGQAVAYTLDRTDLAPGAATQPVAWGAVPMDTVFLRAANTQTNADAITELLPPGGRDAVAPTVAIVLDHPGTAMLGVTLRPWTENLDAADLRARIDGRVAPAAARRLEHAIPAAGPVMVRHAQCAKAVVEVRPLREPDAATATSKTGQPAEIRLLMNPGALKPGSDLPIRVYAAGDKQASAVIRARAEATADLPAAVQTCTTDSSGIGRLRLDRAGLYRAEFLHAEPAEAGAGAAVVLYSATITFFVHEDGHAPDPGAAEETRP